MQQDYRQRNHEIVQLCHVGASTEEIARQFRVTENRARQILSRDARDREAAQRADRLAAEFRMADDLDRTCPVEDLLDALAVPSATRRALELQWAANAVRANRITLCDLMNLVVVPTPSAEKTFFSWRRWRIRLTPGFTRQARRSVMKPAIVLQGNDRALNPHTVA